MATKYFGVSVGGYDEVKKLVMGADFLIIRACVIMSTSNDSKQA